MTLLEALTFFGLLGFSLPQTLKGSGRPGERVQVEGGRRRESKH